MEIKVTQTVKVPCNPYCDKCMRIERDARNQEFCGLFNRLIFLHNGHFVKCRECYAALYEAVTQESEG